MPCYNAESTIAKAIDSIISQHYSNWELIIVDDGSTDKTLKVIKKYLTHSKITLLQNKTNQGCYYSRNRALYHVKDKKWDWCTVHDSDDISTPDRFSIYMAFAYHGSYDYLYSAGQGTRYDYFNDTLKFVNNNLAVGQAFISYNLFTQLGYFNTDSKFGGDGEYNFKFLVGVYNKFSKPLNTTEAKVIENYCFDTKTAIGKIPEEYSYTYKFGYTPNKNLTEIHKEDERRPHRVPL